ncbi:unnamed protein product [Alternaria alternata]
MPTAMPEVEFSKLETTLITDMRVRPISKDGRHMQRHAEGNEHEVNELDLDFDVDLGNYPFSAMNSFQDMFSGIVYRKHVGQLANFSTETSLECFSIDDKGPRGLTLDESNLSTLLAEAGERCVDVPAISMQPDPIITISNRKVLLFFIPLKHTKDTASYGYSVPMTECAVKRLFSSLQLNPDFLQNLLGRPDYWAPQPRWREETGKLLHCDFFCQHPRLNLQAQGAPSSVYMKYDAQRDLLIYLISHKPDDKVILALRKQLSTLIRYKKRHDIGHVLLQSPMDFHTTVSNLKLEASKWHVAKFRRFQWLLVNQVDDQLAGVEHRGRRELASWLKNVQVMAQGVDSHLANSQVFLYTARGICDMATKLTSLGEDERGPRQRTVDMANYLVTSMEKQHMWFLNYRGPKDVIMNLILHLNAQEHTLNTIQITAKTKRDNTSMTSITLLTMVFLPGTFTAVSITPIMSIRPLMNEKSVLSAGIFQSTPSTTSFEVTGLCWLRVVTTVPITLITVACWYLWKRHRNRASS